MKLFFCGDTQNIKNGLSLVLEHLGIEQSDEGIKVELHERPGDLIIKKDGDLCTFFFERTIHFFRGLGLLCRHLKDGEESFSIEQNVQFNHCSIMPDSAGSAPFELDAMKKVLVTMALMGLDEVMFYLEQGFYIPDEPLFGYMLPKYTADDLKKLDDFAYDLGITLYPAIETLGHMSNFFRWSQTQKYVDKGSVLLVNDEETEQLILKMMRCASAPFRSKKINLGMDETFDLGKGRYAALHGDSNLFDLYYIHLRRVAQLAIAEGLEPYIWADMYLMHASSTHFTWNSDLPIPKQAIDLYPEGLHLTHWDYYRHDESWYEYYIKKIQSIDPAATFAGGIWNWTSLVVNQTKTIITTNPALNICKKIGVKDISATIWGGAFGFFGCFLGMGLFAEHMYNKNVDMEEFKKNLEFITGVSYDTYMTIDEMENFKPEDAQLAEPYNVSYSLLFQDILLGLFDFNAKENNFADREHYRSIAQRLEKTEASEYMKTGLINFPLEACRALSIKADLGIRLKEAYDKKDTIKIESIARDELPKLYDIVKAVRKAHFEMWYQSYQSMGFEMHDERYGQLLCRIDTTITLLNKYLSGELSSIKELEFERQPYYISKEKTALHWSLDNIIHSRCHAVV